MLCQATHCTGRMSNVSLIASFLGSFWPGNKTIETTPLHRVWWYMCMMLTIQKYNQNTEFHFCQWMSLINIWPFQQRCSRCSRYQLEWSSTESPAATLVICTTVWRPGEEQGGERRERREREGEERISEKRGRQTRGSYLRAPYVSLGDSDCAATCTIWGWCLFEELRY